MTIEKMRKRKKELGYTNQKISELSGVPLGTVQKIFAGVTDSPRYSTLMALSKILDNEANMIRESAVPYCVKKQGEYTVEDYYALPDDRRAELIDGVIYDMSSPSNIHQMLSAEIWGQLKEHIRKKHGTCVPIIAPADVQLDRDDKTMLQPDVFVVCDRDKILNRCVYGAPDLVIEILSPSTRKRDISTKLKKYIGAGVAEYWIIDPDKKKVVVYDFAHDELPAIYGFDAKVPVGIFDGECLVDFVEIYDYIKFLYEK